MFNLNSREDFENVETTALLNCVDPDNLTLGAEGKRSKIVFLFKY